MRLKKIIQELEACIQQGDQVNTTISEKGTFWHIDHAMRVIAGGINLLYSSEPGKRWPRIHWARHYVFFMGKIPRGTEKAPRAVVSHEPVYEKTLQKRQKNVRFALKLLEKTKSNQFFVHHALGHLNKRGVIRFLEIHTQHHLHIVKDILNQQA